MLGVLVPDLLVRLAEEWAEHRRRWVAAGGELVAVLGVLLGSLGRWGRGWQQGCCK